jgi:hypothetical protein
LLFLWQWDNMPLLKFWIGRRKLPNLPLLSSFCFFTSYGESLYFYI